MNIRFFLALLAARAAMFISRVSGRGKGSSLPGMIALKIYPGTLRELGRQVGRGIIMVTGTNGKTTTNNMVNRVVEGAGHKTIINREGANLITGVTTAFIKDAGLFGRLEADYACLEVDEASFPGVVREVRPDIVVVTNFFRDQLDRYGELDKTVAHVRNAVNGLLHDLHLVLNADDPLVAQLGRGVGKPVVFFGLDEHDGISHYGSTAREAKFCPFCGKELAYKYYHYSQLGRYSCPGCGFSRPDPDVEGVRPVARGMSISCGVRFRQGLKHPLAIPVGGLYNLYNALAAYSVGLLLDIEPAGIQLALGGYEPATGRMERFGYQGKPVLLNLVKNPTGFNEGLAALLAVPARKVNVLIAINDQDADGRDISWLWDVDFEVLEERHEKVITFICTGRRGEEMAVRLKYAGIPVEKITVAGELAKAVREVLDHPGEMSFLLATYTALWPVERILRGYAHKEEARTEYMSPLS